METRCAPWSRCSTWCPRATSWSSIFRPASRCSTNWMSSCSLSAPDSAAPSGDAASRVRGDGHLETRQRIGEIDLAGQARRGIAEVGQFLQQFQLVALRFRQAAGPAFINIHVTGGAGAKTSANRSDSVVELTQNLHNLQTGLCLDIMFFPVPVHYDHPRH